MPVFVFSLGYQGSFTVSASNREEAETKLKVVLEAHADSDMVSNRYFHDLVLVTELPDASDAVVFSNGDQSLITEGLYHPDGTCPTEEVD